VVEEVAVGGEGNETAGPGRPPRPGFDAVVSTKAQ
jgi:hypothetical protein